MPEGVLTPTPKTVTLCDLIGAVLDGEGPHSPHIPNIEDTMATIFLLRFTRAQIIHGGARCYEAYSFAGHRQLHGPL
jgi:hypothetical protein